MTRRAVYVLTALFFATLPAGYGHAQTTTGAATKPASPATPVAAAPSDAAQTPPPAFPASTPDTAPPVLLSKGTMAPDFTVTDRLGNPVKLSSYKGKTVVLDFWATWCIPCQAAVPRANALAEKYIKQNVVFLEVNVWDTFAAFKSWLQQHAGDSSLKFVIDPSPGPGPQSVVTSKFGVIGLPTEFVIGPSGKIVTSVEGFNSDDTNQQDLQKAIAAAKNS